MPQDKTTFQQQFPQAFQQGLADQQSKKWDDAISKYQNLLDQGQNSLTNQQASVIYHNLSVCAFEKSDLPQAYIWSTKSMVLDSKNTFAKNLNAEISKKFQPPQIPHQVSTIENLQNVVLKNVPVDSLLIFNFIILGLCFYLGLKMWFLRRKNHLEAESTSTQKKNPLGLSFGFFASAALAVIFLFLLGVKWQDHLTPKALIAVDKTLVQTASGGNQAVIYDANAGLEVDVLKIEADFVQIRFPGAFSGWVQKKNLEILTSLSWPVKL